MVARVLIITLVLAVSCVPGLRRHPEGPSIEVKPEAWRFPNTRRGETAETEIMVLNRGTDTLTIAIYSSCDCLSATAVSDTIPPGESTPVHVAYLAEGVAAYTAKTLFVDSNDPLRPRVAVGVAGTVLPSDLPYLVARPNPLPVQTQSQGEPATFLTIKNYGEQDLHISDIRCYGCTGSWTARELVHSEEIHYPIELIPGWVGSRWIEIESNDPVTPLLKIAIVEMD